MTRKQVNGVYRGITIALLSGAVLIVTTSNYTPSGVFSLRDIVCLGFITLMVLCTLFGAVIVRYYCKNED